MIKFFKKFFRKKPKKLSLNEQIERINKEYFFNNFNDELIDEIYSILLNETIINNKNIKVKKLDDFLYIIDIDNKHLQIDESGIKFIKPI